MAPKKKAKKKTPKKVTKKKVVKKATPKVSSIGIVPLGDRVVVETIEVKQESQTASGIYIPESAQKEQKESKRGKVVAIGEGRMENGKRISVTVKVGDSVIYTWGDDITVNGKDYTVVSEGNISAIIK